MDWFNTFVTALYELEVECFKLGSVGRPIKEIVLSKNAFNGLKKSIGDFNENRYGAYIPADLDGYYSFMIKGIKFTKGDL